MDTNNWRPIQGGEPTMDTTDWRTQLQHDSRQRIVNKIMDTLKKHLPFSGQEGLLELKKIAERFEEKIYSAATSQSDYLRKISLKMLTMETKSQNNNIPNPLPSNPANSRPTDPGSIVMPPQVHNQGQSLVMPLSSNQSQTRQQLLSQNIQNSAAVQSSSSISSTLPPPTSLSQTSIPNVVGQNPNMQNMSSSSQNPVGYANTQRQVQGRQQVPQQQQQSQNPQSQYLYQQQLQQQTLKPKFQQGNIPQSMLQTHMQQQQQNLLQPTQLQSSQPAAVQTSASMQPPMMQSSLPSLQQNQSSIQQPSKPMLQQHPQSVLRSQPQTQQSSVAHQQQTQMSQQQLMNQQPNSTNMQQSHLIGQQNNAGDLQQQQRLLSQQNNLPNLQQQQQQLMAQQNNISNLHQQQLVPQSNGLQQQLHGTQTSNSNSSMQTNQHSVHMLQQQSKAPMQQQSQPSGSNLLPTQAQQSQPQQQMLSQIQSQPQMQQQLGLQQQPNSLQREMPQRLHVSGQTSGSLPPTQHVIDQQKQLYQSQRPLPETSSTSVDSTAQTGHANGGDWQEEVYQKIKTMKELYLPELLEMYHKIAGKLQQLDSLAQQPPKSEQLEKLKLFRNTLERAIQFLQVPKGNVIPGYKEKLAHYEKQIISFINTNRPRKPVSQLQQGHPSSHMQSTQQPQSQINQVQSHENQMNSQLQSMNVQSSVGTMQQNNYTSLQQNTLSPLSGVSTTQQNVMNPLQSSSNVDSGQGNAMNSLQQVSSNSLQQIPVSAPQHANINAMSSQNGINVLQPNVNNLQSNSNMLQNQQHMKQQHEQQMLQSQQFKQQYQQRQMQQHLMQKQQLLQQQQQHQQQQQQQQLQQQAKQQLPAQLHAHQNQMQHHQINDVNDLKTRPSMVMKSGVFQQHHPAGQRAAYPHQQLKSSSSFAMSSNQLLQASSPQILQHSSPQVEQQNLLPPLTKTGTPLQSASSPFVDPSPSTPLVPSPMPSDSEKPLPGVSSLVNAGNVGQQQTSVVTPAQSLAIGTPGISASPLLAEFSGPDGTHGNTSVSVSGKSSITEQPLDRLIKAVSNDDIFHVDFSVKSMSPKALSASVSDIGSVVSMIDRIAGSAPGNGSRAAVGEDLVAMTNCRLQVRNFMGHDGTNGTRKMKRYTSAMPLNVVSSASSINDSFKQLISLETSELESTATSGIKRPKIEVNHALIQEIREINQRLIDTVVDISNEDVDPSVAAATVEGGKGTIVKCSFSAVALSANLKSQYASARMSPIQPLRLLVPTNYPNCSPILLDKIPVEVSKEYEDLSVKAKSRFSISLRSLSQPMSLGEIARTWDVCARAVISEHAQQSGGGSFSSKYGGWENCLSAA
ncbi:mediator of RNA polymerase II transcription subunit 15a isoform X1 [Cannabis sativa]|uniref:mediator of RNA polymerase II transcription subunit 15a isoform X1 n=1 Tax=Cannabis sativa TaxID=3483 RepID=UPI0029CA4C21|nr:mediator of RNA polymerase II transcription subunit 15a isoform X1 [Cannabis sativa]